MAEISELIRRDIIDELRLSNISWYGRLEEIDFIKRIWDVDKLPSYDARFSDFEGDWFQHRRNNYDWDEDWLYTDSRLDLMKSEDQLFLKVLCTMVHPIVRNDINERDRLLEIFNRNLLLAGLKIIEKKQRGDKSIYVVSKADPNAVEIENEERLSRHEFALQQLTKCQNKLAEGDFDGAITSSRSLMEGVIADVYEQCTGLKLPETGDLATDYRKIKGFLNLSESDQANAALKAITGSFSNIIQGIDTVSNKIGDRHRRSAKPARHHAKLVVNAAKTMTDFFYDTLEYQRARKMDVLTPLAQELSDKKKRKRFLSIEELQSDEEIQKILKPCDKFLKNTIKNHLIQNYKIGDFFDSDVFFALMRIFYEELNIADIDSIFRNYFENDQAVGLPNFLKEIASKKAELISEEKLDEYIRNLN